MPSSLLYSSHHQVPGMNLPSLGRVIKSQQSRNFSHKPPWQHCRRHNPVAVALIRRLPTNLRPLAIVKQWHRRQSLHWKSSDCLVIVFSPGIRTTKADRSALAHREKDMKISPQIPPRTCRFHEEMMTWKSKSPGQKVQQNQILAVSQIHPFLGGFSGMITFSFKGRRLWIFTGNTWPTTPQTWQSLQLLEK